MTQSTARREEEESGGSVLAEVHELVDEEEEGVVAVVLVASSFSVDEVGDGEFSFTFKGGTFFESNEESSPIFISSSLGSETETVSSGASKGSALIRIMIFFFSVARSGS